MNPFKLAQQHGRTLSQEAHSLFTVQVYVYPGSAVASSSFYFALPVNTNYEKFYIIEHVAQHNKTNQEAVDYAYQLFEQLDDPGMQLRLLSLVMQIPFPVGLKFKAIYKKVVPVTDEQKIAIINAISNYRADDAEAVDYARSLFNSLTTKVFSSILRSAIWKIDKGFEKLCTNDLRRTVGGANVNHLLTVQFVKDLYDRISPTAQKNLLATVLSSIVFYHNADVDLIGITKELLAFGCDVNGKDEATGATPLCAIAGLKKDQKGRDSIIQLLVSRGADVNQITAIDIKELLGLMETSMRGSSQLTPQTALTVAIKGMRYDGSNTVMLNALLNHGADPNIKIIDSGTIVTPLFMAIRQGNIDAVETLLKYGADPAITDQNGNAALAVLAQAQQEGYNAGFKKLRNS